MNSIILSNNIEMPFLGFGVFQVTDNDLCEKSVLTALKAGYRLIDTAACYGNEKAVGNAVKKSGINRKDIFIVSLLCQKFGFKTQDTKRQLSLLKKRLKTYRRIILIYI